MGAPVRLQKAVSRSKENAAVERREARRSALWAGSSLPPEGRALPQGQPMGAAFRACEFRRSATLCMGCEGYETDNWDGEPTGMRRWQRGRTREQCKEETAMPGLPRDCFASLAMTAAAFVIARSAERDEAISATLA